MYVADLKLSHLLTGAVRSVRLPGPVAKAEEGTGQTFSRTGTTRSGTGEEHQTR